MNIDYWKFNEDKYAVHIESKRVLTKCQKHKDFILNTTYSKKGKIFAWDILVPPDKLKVIKSYIKQNNKNK